MSILVDGVTPVDVYKVISTVCYGRRRLRRLLQDGPRKSAINECLVTVVELLTEAVERPRPELARDGGLGLLSSLAGAPGLATTTRMSTASVSAQSVAELATTTRMSTASVSVQSVHVKDESLGFSLAGTSSGASIHKSYEDVSVDVHAEACTDCQEVNDEQVNVPEAVSAAEIESEPEDAEMADGMGGPSVGGRDLSDIILDDFLDVDALYANIETVEP